MRSLGYDRVVYPLSAHEAVEVVAGVDALVQGLQESAGGGHAAVGDAEVGGGG